MVQRTPVRGINRYGRASQGVRLMNLKDDDTVSAVALVAESDAEDARTASRTHRMRAGRRPTRPTVADARTALERRPSGRPRTRRTAIAPSSAPSSRFATLLGPEKGGGPQLADSTCGTLEVAGR